MVEVAEAVMAGEVGKISFDFTPEEKLEAIERELKFRRRVYARRVAENKMSQALADRQIALFEAIKSDYMAQTKVASLF